MNMETLWTLWIISMNMEHGTLCGIHEHGMFSPSIKVFSDCFP